MISLKRSVAVAVLLFIAATANAQPRSTTINCELSAVISTSSAATADLVTNANTDRRIYVCSIVMTIVGNATTANTVIFKTGTGTTCGTGTASLTGPITGMIGASANPLVVNMGTNGIAMKPVPVATNLCITTSQASVVAGVITYTIF